MNAKEFRKGGGTFQLVQEYKTMRDRFSKERIVIDTDYTALGKELREIRLSAEITLREMSRRLGCSASFLSDVERGKRELGITRAGVFLAQCEKETKIIMSSKKPKQ